MPGKSGRDIGEIVYAEILGECLFFLGHHPSLQQSFDCEIVQTVRLIPIKY